MQEPIPRIKKRKIQKMLDKLARTQKRLFLLTQKIEEAVGPRWGDLASHDEWLDATIHDFWLGAPTEMTVDTVKRWAKEKDQEYAEAIKASETRAKKRVPRARNNKQ